jgi:hypothetical protein
VNYQNGVYEYCYLPEYICDDNKGFYIISFSLNGVYNFEKWRDIQFYLLAGGALVVANGGHLIPVITI